MNLGRAIKIIRTARNFTQRDLAKKAGLSASYLSLLEKGKRDPNISVLETISQALHIPLTVLIIIAAEEHDLPELGKKLSDKLIKLAFEAINNER